MIYDIELVIIFVHDLIWFYLFTIVRKKFVNFVKDALFIGRSKQVAPIFERVMHVYVWIEGGFYKPIDF